MVGIKKLAERLDLSIGTVSRALNDRPDVNAETRERVLKAAKEIGYVPNQAGRSLRRGQTGVVAFVMQTGEEITGQGDTFFMGIFDGVQNALRRHHLDLVALLCPTDEDAEAYLRRMVARGFADGVILSSTTHIDPRIDFLSNRGLPFVTLGRSTTDAGQPWMDIDFEGMAAQSIDRLVAHGHRRIAITIPHDDTHLGYVFASAARKSLARHGLDLDPELALRFLPTETGGYNVGEALLQLEERPTAIVLLNPSLTTGLYKRLQEAGLEAGKDIAVIGRENPHSQFLQPSLTRFREDLLAFGTALGEALLAVMPAYAEHYPIGTVRKVWPTQLVSGESDDFVLKLPDAG